ncbi:MAG: capsular polysaccharide biosynthesis protein [Mucilaginibacter sp.]|nr:capsular polysaccharide biosynthesis protein [Mucilaginibacter sp.]
MVKLDKSKKYLSFTIIMKIKILVISFKKKALAILRSFKFYRSYALIPKGQISIDDPSLKDKIIISSTPIKMVHELPETIYDEIYWHFNYYIDAFEQRTFVAKIANGRVWGNRGAVITDQGYLLNEVSREFDSEEHSINKLFKLKPYFYADNCVAVLAAAGSENYFHWMFDILPRIHLLKESGLFDEIEKFIVNFDGRNFQKETLNRIGIKDSQLIASNDFFNFHTKVKELVVPSLPSYNGCPSGTACDYLRNLFREEINSGSNKDYIYLFRAYGRKIINEMEVLETLNQFNFKIVDPENFTVAEQAKIFSNAKVVLGAHGAGLANIVFCKPGSIIVDIYAPQWIMPCYWVLANKIGLRYSYLIGENGTDNNRDRNASIIVNINDLKKLLNKLNL